MAKKFDTNPLDPEFPNKVKEAQTTALPNNNGETRKFAEPADTEEQTREFNKANFGSYAYQQGQPPSVYRTVKLDVETTYSRKVAKVGLPENLLTALPYIPYVGLVAGILELLFVPKSEAKVRFHAAQGLAAQIGILIVTWVLDFLPFGDTPSDIFRLVTSIILIVFAVKAYRGKPIHIESVDDLTEWLGDKIKPRN